MEQDRIGRCAGGNRRDGAASDPTDWPSGGLDALIDHVLTTHHACRKSELLRLATMLATDSLAGLE